MKSRLHVHLHVGCQQSAGTEVHGVVNWPLVHVQEARGKVDRAVHVCQWNCTFDQGSGVLLRLSVVVFFLSFHIMSFFHITRGTDDLIPLYTYVHNYTLSWSCFVPLVLCTNSVMCRWTHPCGLGVQLSKNPKHARLWLMIRQNFKASDYYIWTIYEWQILHYTIIYTTLTPPNGFQTEDILAILQDTVIVWSVYSWFGVGLIGRLGIRLQKQKLLFK